MLVATSTIHTLQKSQKSLWAMPISGTRWVFEHSHGLVENTNGQGFPWKEQRIMNLFPISGQIWNLKFWEYEDGVVCKSIFLWRTT